MSKGARAPAPFLPDQHFSSRMRFLRGKSGNLTPGRYKQHCVVQTRGHLKSSSSHTEIPEVLEIPHRNSRQIASPQNPAAPRYIGFDCYCLDSKSIFLWIGPTSTSTSSLLSN